MTADSETRAEHAQRLGVSEAALEVLAGADFIDLHLDSFIPVRVYGYDLSRAHRGGPPYGYCYGHADLPRLVDGGLTGAGWSITTNPFRTAAGRLATFSKNAETLTRLLEGLGTRIVRAPTDYEQARREGRFGSFVAIQGGDAWELVARGRAPVPNDLVTRVTLVHLTSSAVGVTSSPLSILRPNKGLTTLGKKLIEILDERRIFVDLAHIHPKGFWDAVDAHDKSRPLVATHTGVSGVRPHWRNLDDRQLKAIADSGGVAGIIFSVHFLSRRGGPQDGAMIAEHVAHVVKTVGEDFVAIGSDYDGMIVPPKDLRSIELMPRLVDHLLRLGYSGERIRKILGGNFLRAFRALRPNALT
ncbi:MAG: membrane dipeptidase [Deltaproteobacteria bacterium]|nr:membrane dipeptidase [Deltaproteobacteria bacterium]